MIGSGSWSGVPTALALSGGWSVIVWRWVRAFRQMVAMMGRVELSATFDQVEVTHTRGAVEVTHEYPTAGLKVWGEGHRLMLQSGEQEPVSVPCADSDDRDRLVDALTDLSRRAEAPGERSEIPEELSALIGRQKEPAGP